MPDEEVSRTVNVIWSWITAWIFPKKRLFPGELRSRRGIAAARKERERQGMNSAGTDPIKAFILKGFGVV